MLAASSGMFAWVWPLLVLGALACVVAMGLYRRQANAAAFALFMTFFLCGAAYWQAREGGPPGDALARDVASRPDDTIYELEGPIVGSDIWLPERAYITAHLRIDKATRLGETLSIGGGALIRWSDPTFPLYVGDRVRVRGELSLALAHENPGVSGPEAYYRRRGMQTALRVYGDTGIDVESRAPWYDVAALLSKFRAELAARLARAVPAETLSFVLTIWLGDRRQIDSDL
jgi:hypothetical protein